MGEKVLHLPHSSPCRHHKILVIDQVFHFSEQRQGLFRSYIDTWLKLKEEASGWPSWCTTPELQEQHRPNFLYQEGIILENININPGQRALARLMLNSMREKFGQQTNKMQVREFTNPPDFWTFLDSEKHEIRWISALRDERVEVHYRKEEHSESSFPHLNT